MASWQSVRRWSGYLGVHRRQPLLQLPGLAVGVVILGDELDAVTHSVTVANKASERDGQIGIRRNELHADLRTNWQVDLGRHGEPGATQIRALAVAGKQAG